MLARRYRRQEPEECTEPAIASSILATKHSAHPGPRAEAVQPEPHGEGYSYAVKKYWLVVQVRAGRHADRLTRRGKERQLPRAIRGCGPLGGGKTLFFRSRFPRWPPARGHRTTADSQWRRSALYSLQLAMNRLANSTTSLWCCRPMGPRLAMPGKLGVFDDRLAVEHDGHAVAFQRDDEAVPFAERGVGRLPWA